MQSINKLIYRGSGSHLEYETLFNYKSLNVVAKSFHFSKSSYDEIICVTLLLLAINMFIKYNI